VLFLGGWRGPFAEDVPALGFVYLLLKSFIGYFVVMWIRMTLPRVRVDQILDLGWKFLVPLSLVNLIVVAFLWKILPGTDSINSVSDALVPSLVLLAANILMIAGVGVLLREEGRRERARIAARRAAQPVSEAGSVADAAPAGAGD